MNGAQPALLGHFELVRHLGGGGFAVTWLARDLREPASTLVVIKRLRKGLIHRDPVFLESLLSEAEFGMRVHSPHVVRIHRVEELEGEPTVVMEYVDGYRLDLLIRAAAEQGMAPEAVAEIVRQLAEGLLAIHDVRDTDGTLLRLVHQDVKPSNVIIAPSGLVKLIDLGLTRPQRPGAPRIWVRQGTRGYRSPEQHRGDQLLTPASDLYNLGLIMYEALQGTPLFEPDDLSAREMLDKQKQMAIQIEVIAPQIASPGLDIILQRLLAFDIESRYHSAWDLARDIRRWQASWRGDLKLDAYIQRLGARAMRLPEPPVEPDAIHCCDTQPGDRPALDHLASGPADVGPDLPNGSAMHAVQDVPFS